MLQAKDSANPRRAVADDDLTRSIAGLNALSVLYENEQASRDLYKHALSVLGSPELAKDAVQEAFADVTARIKHGTQIVHLYAYLKKTVRNISLQHWRQRIAVPLDEEELDPADGDLPAETVHLKQRCEAIYSAVDRLPAAQRSAFLLAELRGFDYAEVASTLNRSENAVRLLLSRARIQIRNAVGPDTPWLCLPLVRPRPRAGRLADLHASVSELVTRYAQFVTHVAQPAAAIVAATLVVATTAGPGTADTSVARVATPTAAKSAAPTPAARNGSPGPGRPDAPSAAMPRGSDPADPGSDKAAPRGSDNSGDRRSAGGTKATAESSAPVHDASPDQGQGAPTPETPGSDPPGNLQPGSPLIAGYVDPQRDGPTDQPAVGSGGGKVAFASWGSNLVPDDSNGTEDVFLYSPSARTTSLVSVGPDDQPADGPSDSPAVGASAPFVAFRSSATNLVPADTNGADDIFVRNYDTGTTERVSLGANRQQANGSSDRPSLSGDGRYVAFTSSATNLVAGDTNGVADVFVRDRQTDQTERIGVSADGSQANGGSGESSISRDGRYVAFKSSATNLVPEDTNGVADVFVYDRQDHTIQRGSQTPEHGNADGASTAPAISGNGRFVVFVSAASNLEPGDADGRLDVYEYDRQSDTATRISRDLAGKQGKSSPAAIDDQKVDCENASTSFDGRLSAFECGDPASSTDPKGGVFIHDLTAQSTRPFSANKTLSLQRATLFAAIDETGSVLAGVVDTGISANDADPSDPNTLQAVFVCKLKQR